MNLPNEFILKDNGIFPNSNLPVLHYKNALQLPFFFASRYVRRIFEQNGWSNNWRNGIYTYNHYHSNTHEAMAVIKGNTDLLLGGDNGIRVTIQKGDLIVIPAGVAHKNLGREQDVTCIGGYPEGKNFDMNYGQPGERPGSDYNIAEVVIPVTGPLLRKADPLVSVWRKYQQQLH